MQVDVDGDALVLSVLDAADSPSSAASASVSASASSTETSSQAAAAGDQDGSSSSEQKGRSGRRQVHRRERGGAFADRTLRMPDTADMDAISADFESGVLRVRVAKREESQRRQVPIA